MVAAPISYFVTININHQWRQECPTPQQAIDSQQTGPTSSAKSGKKHTARAHITWLRDPRDPHDSSRRHRLLYLQEQTHEN